MKSVWKILFIMNKSKGSKGLKIRVWSCNYLSLPSLWYFKSKRENHSGSFMLSDSGLIY